MQGVDYNFPDDAAYEVSHTVVEELAPRELEVALGFLEPLIEMAEEGELPYIDPRDPGGGFGASDPLFVTIVPAVVLILRQLKKVDSEAVWSRASAEIEEIAKAVNSKRALQQLPALESAIRRICERLYPPRSLGEDDGRHHSHDRAS